MTLRLCDLIRRSLGVEQAVVDCGGGVAEADEFDEVEAGGVLAAGGDGDFGGRGGGVAVDAGGDGGECDGLDVVVVGELETAAVAGSEQCGLVVETVSPDGANGVEDPTGGKEEAGGGFGVAGGAAVELPAGSQEGGAGGPVDCAVYTASAEEGSVGGIDDSVYGAMCNTAGDQC